MKTDDIRRLFLEYFKSKGHEVVRSDSLVPKDDPTLLFTGAGMNQFKEKFMGRNITYRRAASSQKCLRTGDVDNVGRTTGHHTFFEMLGNFSFGDYFKKEAIEWAWFFLTARLKINPERLWASVYKDDEEAYGIWKDHIKIPKEKIIRFGEKDNFWPSEAPTKGPNGPCGPCSEIFYDYGRGVGCGKPGCDPACDCGRFVEVWNLVFTQFDRQSDGSLKPLPSKNIDTGMGLERLASVMQGVKTNFDIDIFVPIVAEIKKFIDQRSETTDHPGLPVGQGPCQTTAGAGRPKINAIADHIRAVAFCVADGVMPSNEERGYVVRKLIRRATSRGHDIGIKEPFLYKLVSVVTEVMKGQYPELQANRDDIAQVVKREEENFIFIIETQFPKVKEAFSRVLASKKDSNWFHNLVFNFYDTYGMPYEMLEEIAEKYDLRIDKDKFEALLEEQRQKSRSKTKIKGGIFSETFARKVESLGLKTEFLGYERSICDDAKVIEVLEGGAVILDKTPFYGESGGQAGDWGRIETQSGTMKIEDAKRFGETIVHIGRMVKGSIIKGETAKLSIDEVARKKTMLNHTATHLLQSALRKVLGDHVRQTGSLVDSGHLRFDFTHIRKMEEREIARVEEIVNDAIRGRVPVKKEIKDIESARREGATALFDEKYGDKVKVVTIGDLSKELCGGTHVDNTGEIETFKIISEGSVASGVRRIEALTAGTAREWIIKSQKEKAERDRLESEKETNKKEQESRISDESARIDEFLARAQTVRGIKVVREILAGLETESLRTVGDRIRQKAGSAVIVLAASTDEKASFIISITEEALNMGLNAGELAKVIAKSVEGSGGGRPQFAQGGGKAPGRLKEALDGIMKTLEERLR